MAVEFGIEVEGLQEAVAALTGFRVRMRVRLADTLRDGADLVRKGASGQAVLRGDVYHGKPTDHGDPGRMPGDLAHKIKVQMRSLFTYDVVEYSRTRSRAYPGGYPYPRRIEYGPGGKAFMAPTARLMSPLVERMVSDMIDELEAEEDL